MPYLKTLRKTADEPFQPGLPEEEEVAVEEVAPSVGVDAAPATTVDEALGAPAVAAPAPAPKPIQDFRAQQQEFEASIPEPELPRVYKNMEALNPQRLLEDVARQGASEPLKALREYRKEVEAQAEAEEPPTMLQQVRSGLLDAVAGTATQFMAPGVKGGKDIASGVYNFISTEEAPPVISDYLLQGLTPADTMSSRAFKEKLQAPVVDFDTVDAEVLDRPTGDGRKYRDVLAERKKVRTYSDVVVDAFSTALKQKYVEDAEGNRKKGGEEYRRDLGEIAQRLKSEDRPNPSVRDAETYLALQYSNRMTGVEGTNLLRAAALTAGTKALEKTAPGWADLTGIPLVSTSARDAFQKVMRDSKEIQKTAPQEALAELIAQQAYSPDALAVNFSDMKPPKPTSIQRAAADVDPEVRSTNEMLTVMTGGVPADITAGIANAEGNKPRGLAFNLDNAVRGFSPERLEAVNNALIAEGIPPLGAGEDRESFGAGARKLYEVVASVDPVAAVRGAAYGRFQVLGAEGSGDAIALVKEAFADQAPEMTDEQAAVEAIRIFEEQPEVFGRMLYAQWWSQPRNQKVLEKIQAGDPNAVLSLTKNYRGTASDEGWNTRFADGRKAYQGPEPEVEAKPDSVGKEAIEALAATLPPSRFAEAEDEARFGDTVPGRLMRGRIVSALGQYIAAGVSGGPEGVLQSLGFLESEERKREKLFEESQDRLTMTQVPQRAFDFQTFAESEYAPVPDTAAFLVSVQPAETLKEENPELYEIVIESQSLGIGQGFQKVTDEFLARRLNELERAGEMPKTPEETAKVEVEAFAAALDAVTALQVQGIWTTPIIVDMQKLDVLGKEYEPPGLIRSWFRAGAPKIEVVGRFGDEIIFRQEGGAMAALNILDAVPIIGQAFNIGFVEAGIELFTGEPRRFEDEVTAHHDALAAADVGHGFMEMLRGGIRGVSTQANLVEVGLRMSAYGADWATSTDFGEEVLKTALEKGVISAPEGLSGEQALLASKDLVRGFATVPGLLGGMAFAIIHPDLLGGGVSAIRGVRAGVRRYRLLPEGLRTFDAFSPRLGLKLDPRVETLTQAGARVEATEELLKLAEEGVAAQDTAAKAALALDALHKIQKGDPGDADDASLAFAEALEELRKQDKYDAARRRKSDVVGRQVDTEAGTELSVTANQFVVGTTDDVLDEAAARQSVGAAAALDANLSVLVNQAIDTAIDRGKKGTDEAKKLAAELEALRAELKLGDAITLSPGRADQVLEESQEAAEVFDSARRVEVLLRAITLLGDADETPEVLRAIIQNRLGTAKTSIGKLSYDELGLENLPLVALEDNKVLPNSALQMFGPVDEAEFAAQTKGLRDKVATLQKKVADPKATDAQRQTAQKALDKVQARLTNSEDAYGRVRGFHNKVIEAFEDGTIFDPAVREALKQQATEAELILETPTVLFRNAGTTGRGRRYQTALIEALDLVDAVRDARTPRQVLTRGLGAVLATSAARGTALQRIALDMVDVGDLGKGLNQADLDELKVAMLTNKNVNASTRWKQSLMTGLSEGLYNLLNETPFVGSRLAQRITPTTAARYADQRTYASVQDGLSRLMSSDGNSTASYAYRLQVSVVRRLEERIKSITEGAGDETPEALAELQAALADWSRAEKRAEVVLAVTNIVKAGKTSPAETLETLKLPIAIDVESLGANQSQYVVSNATQKFLQDSDFLKAYGYAGEEERRAAKLSGKKKTVKRRLRKRSEVVALETVLDQMARFAAGVNAEDTPDVADAKIGQFFEGVRQVRRIGSGKVLADGVKKQRELFDTTIRQRIEELTGQTYDEVTEALSPDNFVVATDDAADLREGDMVYVESAGARVPVGRADFVEGDEVLVTVKADDGTVDDKSFPLADVFAMTKEQRKLETALYAAQFDALEETLAVMTETEALLLFKRSKAEMEDVLKAARRPDAARAQTPEMAFFQEDAAAAGVRGADEVEEARILFQQPEPSVEAAAKQVASADAEQEMYTRKLREAFQNLPEDAKAALELLDARREELPFFDGRINNVRELSLTTGYSLQAQRNNLREARQLVASGQASPEQYRFIQFAVEAQGDTKLVDYDDPVFGGLGVGYQLKAAAERLRDYVVDVSKKAIEEGLDNVTLSRVLDGSVSQELRDRGAVLILADHNLKRANERLAAAQAALDEAGIDFTLRPPVPTRNMLLRSVLQDAYRDISAAARRGEPTPNIDVGKIIDKIEQPKRRTDVGEFGEGERRDFSERPEGPAKLGETGEFEDFSLAEVFDAVPATGLTKPEDVVEFVPTERGDTFYERAARGKRGRSAILEQIRRKRDKLGRAWRRKDGIATISDEEYDTVKAFVAMVGTKRLENIALTIEPSLSKDIPLMRNEPLGLYMFGKDIIGISDTSLASGRFVDTTIHELWHGLSQYLPDDTVEELYKQFVRERETFMRANPGAFDREGGLVAISMAKDQSTYRFSSFDEWVVEKMKDLSIEEATGRVAKKRMRGMDAADDPADKPWYRALRALADLVRSHYEQIKAVFGKDVARQTYNEFMRGKYIEQVRNTPLADVIKLTEEDQAAAATRWNAYLDALDAGTDEAEAAAEMSAAAEKFIEGMLTGPAEVMPESEFKALFQMDEGAGVSAKAKTTEVAEIVDDTPVASHNVLSVYERYGPPMPLKAVDGGPLSVYQGNQASGIYGADGGSEAGIYLAPNRRYAATYGPNVHETYIALSNPLVVENKGEISPADLTHADIRRLIEKGHDGIIVKNPGEHPSKASEIVAFSKDSLLGEDINAYNDARYAREDYESSRGVLFQKDEGADVPRSLRGEQQPLFPGRAAPEAPKPAATTADMAEVKAALRDADKNVETATVVKTPEEAEVKDAPFRFRGLTLDEVAENEDLLDAMGLSSIDDLFADQDYLQNVDPDALSVRTPVQVFSEEGEAIFTGPARIESIDENKQLVKLRGADRPVPIARLQTLAPRIQRMFIGDKYSDLGEEALEESLVNRGIKTEGLGRGAQIEALVNDDLLGRRAKSAAARKEARDALGVFVENNFVPPVPTTKFTNKARSTSSGTAQVVRRYTSPLFKEPVVRVEPVEVEYVRLRDTEPKDVPKTRSKLEAEYRNAAKLIGKQPDEIAEGIRLMRRNEKGRTNLQTAMVERLKLAEELKRALEINKKAYAKSEGDADAGRRYRSTIGALERAIKRLETGLKRSFDDTFTSPTIGETQFKTFEVLQDRLAKKLARPTTVKGTKGLKYRDVVDNLKPEVQDVTRRFLAGLEDGSVTADRNGLRIAAGKKMKDETLDAIEGLLVDVGILKAADDDVTVVPRAAEDARAVLLEVFSDLSDETVMAGRLDLSGRVGRLLAEALTEPSTIIDDDVEAFISTLKRISPKEYDDLVKEAMLDSADNLLAEIAYENKRIAALVRARDRAKSPETKAYYGAAIANVEERMKTLERLVETSTPGEELDLLTARARAKGDFLDVEAAPKPTRAQVREAAKAAKKAAKEAQATEVEKMPKGMVRFLQDSTAILYAFKKADVSTGLHEMAHVMRRALSESQLERPLSWINSQLKARGLEEVSIVEEGGRRQFKTASGQLDSVVEAEELFARAFERFLREGDVPNTVLRRAFATMKELLKRIYTAISGTQIDVEISSEMYDFFDEMFGASKEVSLDELRNVQLFLDTRTAAESTVGIAVGGRIEEQRFVPRNAMDRMRLTQRSLQDYRARGFGFGGPVARLVDKVEGVESTQEGLTAGVGRMTRMSVGAEANVPLGPVSRRYMTVEKISELGSGGRPSKFFQRMDNAVVAGGTIMYGVIGSTLTYGGDPMRLFRRLTPEMRMQALGFSRESEEFMSELTMRVLDAARVSVKDRPAALRNLIRYLRGEQTRLLTGAQRGQRARQNFVDTEFALLRHIADRSSKLADDSLELLIADAQKALADMGGEDVVREGYHGALTGFWKKYAVRKVSEKRGVSQDRQLFVAEELEESVGDLRAQDAKGPREKQTADEVSDYFLKNVHKSLTGLELSSGQTAVVAPARNLAALMLFHSGVAPMKASATLKDGREVPVLLTLEDSFNRGFNGLMFGTVLRRELEDGTVVTRTLPGLMEGDTFKNSTIQQRMATLLVMAQSGYVAGVYDDMRKIGFGISGSDYRAYGRYLSGDTDLLTPEEIERARLIEKRYGRTSFTLAPTLDKNLYIPTATRTSLADTLSMGARQAGTEGNRDIGLLRGLYGYIMQNLIFGGVFQRQTFKFMSTVDLGLQLGLVAGGSAGAAAASRAAALTLLTAVEGERLAEIVEGLTTPIRRRMATTVTPAGTPDRPPPSPEVVTPGMFKAIVREFVTAKGDEATNAVTNFLGVSKYRAEVAPIMENSDQLFAIGDRVYKASDLRRAFTRAGMYSNAYKDMRAVFSLRHDTPAPNRSRVLADADEAEAGLSPENQKFLQSARNSVGDFTTSLDASRAGGAISVVAEHGLESADAWSDLERTGAAVTLMEMGYSPFDAARIVIDAVYDYRGSMTETDRSWVRRVLMPFFAFRKNAMAQATNFFASPEGAFRTIALQKALRFGTEGFTEVMYENILQPYDMNVTAMPVYIRNSYYATRLFLEYGVGDTPNPEELAPFRDQLPPDKADISDEELLDYDFNGWTLRNGYGGYRNVPETARIAMRALIAGRQNAGIRTNGDVKVLSGFIIDNEIRQRYINEGATMAVRASAGEYGLPAWAARRNTVQVPIPVLDESVKEVLGRQQQILLEREGPTAIVGDSVYFVLPDTFIQAAIDHAGALLAGTIIAGGAVFGEDLPENVRFKRFVNAMEPIVDARTPSPVAEISLKLMKMASGDTYPTKKYISPWAARLIEGSLGTSIPHDGDRDRSPFLYTAGQLLSFGAGAPKTFEEGEGPGIRPRMYSRQVQVVVEDSEGRRETDENFDASTAARKVVPAEETREYTVEGDELAAYKPYLTGVSAMTYRYSLLGQAEAWLKSRYGDTPLEQAIADSDERANAIMEALMFAARQIGVKVEVSDPQRAALIDSL